MNDPAISAFMAVQETMKDNQGKHGDAWKGRSPIYDLLKAQRHITTALLELTGQMHKSGEDHVKLAATRIAIALSNQS